MEQISIEMMTNQHSMYPTHITNGNDGHENNKRGTLLRATHKRKANHDNNITKIFPNAPFHIANGWYGLGRNGCGTQLQETMNENGNSNHHAIDNISNVHSNEYANDKRTVKNLTQ